MSRPAWHSTAVPLPGSGRRNINGLSQPVSVCGEPGLGCVFVTGAGFWRAVCSGVVGWPACLAPALLEGSLPLASLLDAACKPLVACRASSPCAAGSWCCSRTVAHNRQNDKPTQRNPRSLQDSIE